MREDRASKTAEHNALFRALETGGADGGDGSPLDPLAARFLSVPFAGVARLGRTRPGRKAITRFIDWRWPGVRTSVVARTALIDDIVADLLSSVGQTVVLGAGFDSRAWRLPALGDRAVFEVDHPATQARKRSCLDRAGVDSARVRFVATDFQTGDLGRGLAAAGFDRDAPALVLWEGVTNYLTASAVDATVRWCGRLASGSHLVFTYIDRRVLTDPSAYYGAQRVLATLRRAGEEFTFGLSPSELPHYLAARRLRLVSDTGAPAYRQQYFGADARRMRGHEFYRVAHATVCGQPARQADSEADAGVADGDERAVGGGGRDRVAGADGAAGVELPSAV